VWIVATLVVRLIPNPDGSVALIGTWLAVLGGGAFLGLLTLGREQNARLLGDAWRRLSGQAGTAPAAPVATRDSARWVRPSASAPGLFPALLAWQPVWLPALVAAIGWGAGWSLFGKTQELLSSQGAPEPVIGGGGFLVFQLCASLAVALAVRLAGKPVRQAQVLALVGWTVVAVIGVTLAGAVADWQDEAMLSRLVLVGISLQLGLVLDGTVLRGVRWAEPWHRSLAVLGWGLALLITPAEASALTYLVGLVGGMLLSWLLYQARPKPVEAAR
jgi:hypothetical protein